MRTDGHLRWTRTPSVLRRYGRLRSITLVMGGDLLVTSDKTGATTPYCGSTPRPGTAGG